MQYIYICVAFLPLMHNSSVSAKSPPQEGTAVVVSQCSLVSVTGYQFLVRNLNVDVRLRHTPRDSQWLSKPTLGPHLAYLSPAATAQKALLPLRFPCKPWHFPEQTRKKLFIAAHPEIERKTKKNTLLLFLHYHSA